MNILEELKLSKRQNNNKRYDYLCKQFNVVDYAIKLEKYTIKLQKENKLLKENYERIYNENCILKEKHNINDISLLDENYKIKDNWNKLKEWLEEGKKVSSVQNNRIGYNFTTLILDKMQELEGSDSNERFSNR